MACGTALERRCPACGTPAPAEARFCMACGSPLPGVGAPAPPPPSAAVPPADERRRATVLFADLSGYTAVAERMDPEEVKALVDRCLHRLAEEVDRHGGRVDKYIGDNVMAIFGAPVAHEDDAERAVRAALAMQDAMTELNESLARAHGVSLDLRVGVNTGEVLAGNVGDGYTVIGDAVNVAARLQAAARPGTVSVGEQTVRATRDAIDYAEPEPLALKGKARPVLAWRAAGLLAKQPVRRALGPSRSPLVGRDAELGLLGSLVDRVRREGSAHLVTVIGEAGVGKSRLLHEFEQRLAGGDDPPRVRKGRCLPYGSGIVYWALGEVLRAEFGIVDADRADVAWTKLRAGVDQLLGAADRDAAVLGRLLGIEPPAEADVALDDPQRLRDSFFGAVRACVEALAAQRPLVLAVEDIHWADEGMLDLIEHLTRRVRAPLLILCLARGELYERRAAWGGGMRSATTLALEPLSEEQTRELVALLLDGGAGTAGVAASVAARVGGNPLFAEELARRLSEERDADAAELPDTVHAVLAARLDSLAPFERRVVQHAAVAGRTFLPAWLARVALEGGGDIEAALASLQDKDLIVPAGRGRIGAEGEFAFKHVLIRDVAYAQLPRAVRARRHHEMGIFIEEQAGDRADELVALLAEHYGRAAELAVDAALPGDEVAALRTKALRALEAAGDAAAALYSNGEAFDQFAAAARLAGADDAASARIREKQGDVALALGRVDAAIEAFEACAEHARAQEDLRRLADLNRKIGSALWHKGETKAAVARYQRGIALLKDGEPCIEIVRLYEEAASLYMHTGDNMLAIYAAEKALRTAERVGESRAASRAHGIFGRVFGRIGDNAKARENLEKSVALARDTSEGETIRALLSLGSHLELSEADYRGAERAYCEALAAAKRVGDMPSQVELQAALALLAAYRADWPAVERNAGESLDLAQREGLTGKVAYPLGLHGLLRWRDGDFAEAERLYREAIGLADRVGWSEVAFHARFGLALALRDAGDAAGATAPLDEAIAVCEHAGLPGLLAQAAALRVTVLALAGRDAEAAAAAAEIQPGADPVAAAAALQARGAAAGGHEGADLLAQARDLWERLERGVDAAFCDLLAARALAGTDTPRSRALAEAAAERCAGLGVPHLVARAQAAAAAA